MTDIESRRRFRELLPWHGLGMLSEDERRWMESYLLGHADARTELRWQAKLQARMHRTSRQLSPEIGMARLRGAPAPAQGTIRIVPSMPPSR